MNFDELVENQETAAPAKRGLELRRRPPAVFVGGLPTVSLLPRELRAAARDKSIRRILVGAVVVAVVVVGGATAGATALTATAQSRLDASNAMSGRLAAQLGKFTDVQKLQQSIALGTAAVKVGTSTEIDWQKQLDAVQADMPTAYTVTSITADSATPVLAYAQGTTPLEMPRAATATLNIDAPTITLLPIWLRKLRSIPAYADATASVTPGDNSGYQVTLVVHLSPKALENATEKN